jgi:hypothetical protein
MDSRPAGPGQGLQSIFDNKGSGGGDVTNKQSENETSADASRTDVSQ